MLIVSRAVARAALMRQESRGAHSRLDFPELRRLLGRAQHRDPKDGDGMRLTPTPVVKSDELVALVEQRKEAGARDEQATHARDLARRPTAASWSHYEVEAETGMVVLDAVLEIQRTQAKDLAVRWNCKAAKCGSCSAEINGRPRLMCKTRLDHLPGTADHGRAAEGLPGDPRPRHRRLVELRGQPADPAVHAGSPTPTGLIGQEDVDRMAEFRKCIECFLCQDVCHILRDHGCTSAISGPGSWSGSRASRCTRWTRSIALDLVADEGGIGLCNITKCCTRGVPGGHPHHRQRDHPPQGARRRPPLRPAVQAAATVRPSASALSHR